MFKSINQKIAWVASGVFALPFIFAFLVFFLPVLHEWQTLTAGVLSVFAAMATIIYLRKQISQSDKHEAERLERLYTINKIKMRYLIDEVCLKYAYKIHNVGEVYRAINNNESCKIKSDHVVPEEVFFSLADVSGNIPYVYIQKNLGVMSAINQKVNIDSLMFNHHMDMTSYQRQEVVDYILRIALNSVFVIVICKVITAFCESNVIYRADYNFRLVDDDVILAQIDVFSQGDNGVGLAVKENFGRLKRIVDCYYQ